MKLINKGTPAATFLIQGSINTYFLVTCTWLYYLRVNTATMHHRHISETFFLNVCGLGLTDHALQNYNRSVSWFTYHKMNFWQSFVENSLMLLIATVTLENQCQVMPIVCWPFPFIFLPQTFNFAWGINDKSCL